MAPETQQACVLFMRTRIDLVRGIPPLRAAQPHVKGAHPSPIDKLFENLKRSTEGSSNAQLRMAMTNLFNLTNSYISSIVS